MSNSSPEVSKKVGVVATVLAAFVYWLLAGAGVNIKVECLWCVNVDPKTVADKPIEIPAKPVQPDSMLDLAPEPLTDEYDNCYGLILNKPEAIAAPPRVLANSNEPPNQTIRRLMFYISTQRNYIEQYETGVNTFITSYNQNCK